MDDSTLKSHGPLVKTLPKAGGMRDSVTVMAQKGKSSHTLGAYVISNQEPDV